LDSGRKEIAFDLDLAFHRSNEFLIVHLNGWNDARDCPASFGNDDSAGSQFI